MAIENENSQLVYNFEGVKDHLNYCYCGKDISVLSRVLNWRPRAKFFVGLEFQVELHFHTSISYICNSCKCQESCLMDEHCIGSLCCNKRHLFAGHLWLSLRNSISLVVSLVVCIPTVDKIPVGCR